MRKTKYEVIKSNGVVAVYVTEKRNAEDMIQQIRKMHQKYNSRGEPTKLVIEQVCEGERKIIYTPKMINFWEKDLVL